LGFGTGRPVPVGQKIDVGSHENDLSLKAREELQAVGGKLITFDQKRIQNLVA